MRAELALGAGAHEEALRLAGRAVADLDEQDDVTGWLATAHLLAGALAHTGRPADGAVLLGAVDALGGRVGYAPERMDPLNAPGHVEAVASRLDPDAYAAALARGRRMDRAAVRAHLGALDRRS
nr:hypothetical protein GCM10020063_068190 [Dactylosporangium thailandense]